MTRQSPRDAAYTFVVLCTIAVVLAGGYLAWTRQGDPANSGLAPVASGTAPTISEIQAHSYLLFRDTSLGESHGRVVLKSLLSPLRRTTDLTCERVHFAAGHGVCLTAQRGVVTDYSAVTLDATLAPRHRLPLPGVPSRVRVSPDGYRAGVTVFISGDSYAPGSFSTRTIILETESGKSLGDLEQYSIVREDRPFKATDFNFWGVTFADRNHFYATLGTGGRTYLVEADADARRARVIHENVECPSLSPDGTRVAFKRRLPGARLVWRLHVLNLDSKEEWALAETRSVDDQVEWLDSETVAYGLPSSETPGSTDIWSVLSSRSGVPTRVVRAAWSPSAVRIQ